MSVSAHYDTTVHKYDTTTSFSTNIIRILRRKEKKKQSMHLHRPQTFDNARRRPDVAKVLQHVTCVPKNTKCPNNRTFRMCVLMESNIQFQEDSHEESMHFHSSCDQAQRGPCNHQKRHGVGARFLSGFQQQQQPGKRQLVEPTHGARLPPT